MNKKYWLLAVLIALLGWLGQPAAPVQAHANLLFSTPAPGDVVTTFPTSVTLEFSEAVALNSARLELLDEHGQVLDQGKILLSPDNGHSILAAFPSHPHPDGIYNIRWEVQSVQDGHITNGTIPFSVGKNTPQVSLLPPPGAPDPATDLPSALEVMLRGLGYLSLVFLVGPAVFGALIWGPAFRYAGKGDPGLDETMTRWFRRLMVWGGIAGLASLAGLAVWQEYELSGFSGGTFSSGEMARELYLHMTWVSWVRVILLAALIALARWLPPAGQGRTRFWWAAVGGGFLLTLTYSLSGHNAASGSVLAVFGDWLHVSAMSIWVGGLLPLAVILLRQRKLKDDPTAELTAIVSNRFSDLALVSVILLGISGLFSALLQVQTVQALRETRYGQALVIKTILFALLIGFGAVNQRLLLPRMARSEAARSEARSAFQWLGRTVRAEYGLALLLLFVVGALMSLSPAYAALQADRKMGYHEQYREGPVQIDLRIAPAVVGQDEFGVDVQDNRPNTGQPAPTVLLRFRMLMEGMDQDTTQVTAAPSGHHRYTVRGSYMSMEGIWEVVVIVRRPGMNDIQHAFTIDLGKLDGE